MKSIVNPIEYAKIAAEDYRKLYETKLVSVILYGSAAGGDFNPEKSDINLLIVLTSMDIGIISESADIQSKYLRRRFSRPLVIDREYIASSCDSYPMEFLDMKERYHVLIGEDVLSSVSPKMEHLRLQVERELKGKWLHLMDEFTFSCKDHKRLFQLTDLSLKAFSPVFRALLKLKNTEIPLKKSELFSAVESAYSINGRPFQNMNELYNNGNFSELKKQYPNYSRAIKILIDSIEKIKTEQ